MEPVCARLTFRSAMHRGMQLRDRHGRWLPAGSSFVLPRVGGFTLWTDAPPNSTANMTGGSASPGETDQLVEGALIAQLRELMGLPPLPPTAARSEGDELCASDGRGIELIEVLALQLGCARHSLDQLQHEMEAVKQLERFHFRVASLEGRDLSPLYQQVVCGLTCACARLEEVVRAPIVCTALQANRARQLGLRALGSVQQVPFHCPQSPSLAFQAVVIETFVHNRGAMPTLVQKRLRHEIRRELYCAAPSLSPRSTSQVTTL